MEPTLFEEHGQSSRRNSPEGHLKKIVELQSRKFSEQEFQINPDSSHPSGKQSASKMRHRQQSN
jgi:hypothetical protein